MVTDNGEFVGPEDISGDWEPVEGAPDGISEKVLFEDPDGSNATFVRHEPGVTLDRVLEHDCYEEVIILEGSLVDTRLETEFTAGMYGRRTPGTKHGPYEFPEGCLTLEIQYYK